MGLLTLDCLIEVTIQIVLGPKTLKQLVHLVSVDLVSLPCTRLVIHVHFGEFRKIFIKLIMECLIEIKAASYLELQRYGFVSGIQLVGEDI